MTSGKFRLVADRCFKRAVSLLALALASLAGPVGAQDTPPTAAARSERLAVGFLSSGFLAEVVERIESRRIEAERLTAYLQEETGLIWAGSDNGKDLDWYAAADHCRDLELADWDDWRLPTIDELERLHDRRSTATHKLPSTIRLTGCCPWSSTKSGDTSAWNFSFRYRKRFSGSVNYSYELRALCVREADADDVLFYEQAAEEAKRKLKEKRRS